MARAEKLPGDARRNLYGHRWRKARAAFLGRHPLCAMCSSAGRVTEATVVDHVAPHKGDAKLFWDRGNWQALCKSCHDGAKQREERRGYGGEVGRDGWPLDPRHPVNRRLPPDRGTRG